MTKTRSTKSALISSVIALLLCFAMLVGSTFAWFTDSVTSANNIIKSGNLDIALDYWDGDSWETVEGTDSLFTNNLWEPGHTEVVYLKLSNLGSLALKYQLAISVLSETEGTNMAGDPFKLSDYIQMGVVEGVNGQDAPYATREAAVDAVKDASGIIGAGYAKQGNMLSGDPELYMAVVVYMPETVGNEANAKTGTPVPTINLGVQVLATQYTAEGDSFGTDYDEEAWAPGMQVYTADDLQAAINNGETNITLMDDIELNESIVVPAAPTTYSLRNATPATVIDLNGKTITGNVGRDADGNRVHVIVNNGNAVIKNGVITSAGVNGGSAIYNADGATLTVENVTLNGAPQEGSTWPSYTVNNYGTLTVSDSSIYGVQGIIATNNTANTTVNNVIAYRDGWSSGHVFYTSSTAKVTINGGTYTNDGNGVDGTMIYGGETVVNGGTFIVKEGAYFALCSGSKLTVNGGDFSNIKSCIAWGGAMTISGGTFGFNPTTYVADGYHALSTGGKYYVVPQNIDAVVSTNEELQAAVNACKEEIILTEGEFTVDLYNIVARDSLTITGQGAATKLNFKNQQVRLSQFDKSLTINNLEIGRMVDKSWGQLVFGGSDNAGGVYTISECIFNGLGTQGIYINQDVDATVNVEKCTFNGDFGEEGAITIQNNDAVFTVNVNDCEFNNIPENSHDIYVVPYEDGTWYLNVDGKVTVATAKQLANVVANGATEINLLDGVYDVYNCGGKTLTISGSANAVIKVMNEGESGCDYGFDGSTVTFDGVTFDTSLNNGNYKGFARMKGIYNECTFNGSYALNDNGTFTKCVFNVSGDAYNLWTWGAPEATFTGCTFNSDGKAVLLYGGTNTKLTLDTCVFNDNGGLTDLKAAIEIGNDYNKSYELIVNNTVVNGYEINDKGINTGSTLWGNKNSMGTDKLNVVVDGVDVY